MKFFRFLFCSALIAGTLALSGCGKDPEDEPVDPNRPETVDPNDPAADPTGTVSMRMRNDNATRLGQMVLSSDNNFYCEEGLISSIGPVKGLGTVTDIPVSGWSKQVAVTIGNAYVYYDGKQYYRIFVTGWMKDAITQGIIGVEFKYQTPFKGLDEKIELENSTVSFSGDGGTETVWFTNKSIIPFTVEVDKNCDWLEVARSTSDNYDTPFLYNGITLLAKPSNLKEESRARVEITTLNGQRTVLTVVRGSETSILLFPNGENTISYDDIDANGYNGNFQLTTNVSVSDLKVVSSADWLEAEVTTRSMLRPKARFIEGGIDPKTVESRASEYLNIRLMVSGNCTAAERQATITFSSTRDEKTAVMSVTQRAGQLTVAQAEHKVDAKKQTIYITLTNNVASDFSVTSDKNWCHPLNSEFYAEPGNTTLAIDLDENASKDERNATVTIASMSGSLNVKVNVIQGGVSLNDIPAALYFTAKAGNITITLPVSDVTATSSAQWCTTSTNGRELTVRVASSTEDRICTLTLNGLGVKITVDQSKYQVGDTYSEKGIEGIVCIMDGEKRLVRTADKLAWEVYSTEEVSIGAVDRDNGLVNMQKVKSFAGWEEFYPAFAEVDKLNVDGVTGWYLPAVNEAAKLGVGHIWSSTEDSRNNAYRIETAGYSQVVRKSDKNYIYAVHTFVK